MHAQRLTLDRSAPPPPWVAGATFAIITVLVHVFLVEIVLMGEGRLAAHLIHRERISASALAGQEEPRGTLILIDAPGVESDPSEPLDSVLSRGKVLQSLHLTIATAIPSFETLSDAETQDEEGANPAQEASAEELGRATLFGKYLGQIQARIQRAWVRPRSPIGDDAFDCNVQIVQDERGNVLETTLQRCNGNAIWQVSLVRAIERASPLPAPPDPKVFTNSLRLDLRSVDYTTSDDKEGFEPALHNIEERQGT